MKRLHTGAALAALTVAAAMSAAGSASAQTYNRLVVFGDSLSDNGNLYAVTGGTQPPAAVYWQGRFSTGPTFVELLGFNLGRYTAGAPVSGSVNYAFGGARTDSQASPPGMRVQLAAYTGAGGRFGPNDLVSILGGANNIFQGLPAAGASANPTAAIAPIATSAATDINFITNSVAAAGAGTILVTNLPKLSLTPQFAGTTAAPLADYAVTTFNSALLTGLTATAAANPNSNIIVMDLYKVGDAIAGSPDRFGITNVTQACFNGVTLCSNSSGYFYLDGVHPTALGHRLIAKLATDYLYYGDRGASSAVIGETTFRQREADLDFGGERLSSHEAWEEGTSILLSGSYDSTDTDARGTINAFESESKGVRLGIEHSWSGSWKVGLNAGYRTTEVDSGQFDADIDTYAFDVYAGWRSGNVFVNASAGGSHDKIDTARLSALDPIVMTGETVANTFGARVGAGMWFGGEGLAISPRVAVSWINSGVDGFDEQGFAAQYRYHDRDVTALAAEVALRAEGDIAGFGVFVEGGYRDALDDSSDPVTTSIVANTAHALEREVEDPFGGQFLASAGVSGDFGPLKVEVGYRGRFGDHADSHTGGITLRLPLQ
jgi:outer membrane lipase/esterase